jgi:hypothetical protein
MRDPVNFIGGDLAFITKIGNPIGNLSFSGTNSNFDKHLIVSLCFNKIRFWPPDLGVPLLESYDESHQPRQIITIKPFQQVQNVRLLRCPRVSQSTAFNPMYVMNAANQNDLREILMSIFTTP